MKKNMNKVRKIMTETLEDEYDRLEEIRSDDLLNDDATRRMVYIRRSLDRDEGNAESSFINEVPDSKHDGRTIKSSITRDKKDFLSEHLNVDINVRDGPASKELIKKMKISDGC